MNDDAAAAGTAVRPPFSIQPSSQLHYYKTGPSQSSRRPPFAPSPSGSREPTHGQDRGDSASAHIGVANAAADSQGNPATHWPPPRSSSLAFEPPPEINELRATLAANDSFLAAYYSYRPNWLGMFWPDANDVADTIVAGPCSRMPSHLP